jgi:hypothetical protein
VNCTGKLVLSAVEHLSGRKITAISAAKRKTTPTVVLGRASYTVRGAASAAFTIKLNGTILITPSKAKAAAQRVRFSDIASRPGSLYRGVTSDPANRRRACRGALSMSPNAAR